MATFKSVSDIKEKANAMVWEVGSSGLIRNLLIDTICIKEGKKWNESRQEWEDNEEAKGLLQVREGESPHPSMLIVSRDEDAKIRRDFPEMFKGEDNVKKSDWDIETENHIDIMFGFQGQFLKKIIMAFIQDDREHRS